MRRRGGHALRRRYGRATSQKWRVVPGSYPPRYAWGDYGSQGQEIIHPWVVRYRGEPVHRTTSMKWAKEWAERREEIAQGAPLRAYETAAFYKIEDLKQ
jgi:hypothetical protein